nr:AAA family ATPase [uncultured Carboxylicivirga sp.]
MNNIHGAKWWKFDFHNHTPKSIDYGRGDDTQKEITCKDWLLEYMQKEIDCIAVSDHNTGSWIDLLKIAYKELKEENHPDFRQLYIFPAVEISVHGGIHLLAILDLDKSSEDIALLIGDCGYSGTPGDSNGVTTKSLEQVIETIVKKGGIAIPAHVDEGAGMFGQITGPSLEQTLRNNSENLLALELIDKNYEFPELYKQSKLNLTNIVGSDSHKIEEIGRRYSWVKMSTPTIDALKLALHDGDDGVIRFDSIEKNPNEYQNKYFIKSIKVENGFKAGNGNPLISKFNPWLSSIIGGRGSGKSTIVNYLRIALDRVDEMPTEVQNEFNKFFKVGKKGVSGMLRDNTKIEVEIFNNGILQTIKWENNVHTLKTMNSETNMWSEPMAVTNIKELFPIQIFNQKELYSLTNNPSKLIDLIDSQFDKLKWNEEKKQLLDVWLSKRAKQRQLNKSIEEEKNLKAQIDSTANKIKLYESSEFKDTLNNYNQLNSLNEFFNNTNSKIVNLSSQIENLKASLSNIEVPDKIKDLVVDDSFAFIEGLNVALTAFEQKISEAIELIAPYKPNLLEQIQSLSWHEKYKEAKSAYDAIIDKIKEFGNESYEVLIQRQSSLKGKMALIQNQKNELEELKTELTKLYSEIISKEKELRIKRQEIINKWKETDNGEDPFLTIELQTMGDTEQANSSFRKLMRKEGNEFANNIYTIDYESETSSGIISEIIEEEESKRWDKRLEVVAKFIQATESDKKGFDLRLVRHVKWLKDNTPEDIDRLIVWTPEDRLVLKFKKQGKSVDIQSGSAGERTAGMLGLLIALNNMPLIIDQPEDDLDTRLISKFVVPSFKNLKQNRQLILVTHNPNIAVNANSDNIIHMSFNNGQIVVSDNDALQERDIRNAVCEVMEGGKTALNSRYYRISKALN